MVENVIKTFKLNYDGTFDEIDYENIKDVFTIVNILAIYIQKIKTMYIWIGRNATQALKNHVAQIRVLLKEEFPQFRIIRNYTFDMRSETYDFFKNLNITKEELYEIINYQEKTVLPILEKIEEIKEKSEISIESEQYKNAIELLKEIIGLAEKIQDDALVTEQKRLISELTEKFENKQVVSEIEQETSRVETEYNKLIKAKRIIHAHELVEAFIKKYETVYDLSLIPSAKELMIKEKRKWIAEQEKIVNDLSRMEKDLKSSLESFDISKTTEIYEKGLNLISNLLDEKVKTKWKGFSNNIQDAKIKVEFIKKFDNFSEEIIKLKEVHQYDEIKSKIEILIKQVDQIDLPEYRGKLDVLNKEIDSAEKSYNKILEEIRNLEKEIIDNQKNNRFENNLRDCEKIIELSKSINKSEIINKYSEVLKQTKLKLEGIREFEEKQRKLGEDLLKLEKELKASLKQMNLSKANEILEKSKLILGEIVNEETKKHWRDLEQNYLKTKRKKELIEKIDIFIQESGSLKENFQFGELKIKLTEFINKAEELEISTYIKKLKILKTEVDTSEESYNNTTNEIVDLEENIRNNIKNDLLEELLNNCDKIIKLANSIKNLELIKKYTTILEQTKEQIKNRKEFEEKQRLLKEELIKLEKEFNLSIKAMELNHINEILEKGEEFLNELVDDEIKEKWDNLKAKFHNAKQLLENIEILSKNGMVALNKASCPNSLDFFEKIIHQLQEYKS